MAKRPNLTDITNVLNSASTHNANNDEIELAFDNTLSRDGSTPNEMGADFDMNSNDILNAQDVGVLGTLTVQGVDINDLLNGVGPGTVFNTTNRFSGDDSTVLFTLSKEAGSRANTWVYLSGVYQQKNTYSLVGTALTFSEAPPKGTLNVEVVIQESTESITVAATDVNTTIGSNVQEAIDQASYPTRALLEADKAAGKLWPAGEVVFGGKQMYQESAGSTELTGLPDFLPYGNPTPDHWTENITPGTTDMSTAINLFDAYLISSGIGAGEFLSASYRADSPITKSNITVWRGPGQSRSIGSLGAMIETFHNGRAITISGDSVNRRGRIEGVRVLNGNQPSFPLADGVLFTSDTRDHILSDCYIGNYRNNIEITNCKAIYIDRVFSFSATNKGCWVHTGSTDCWFTDSQFDGDVYGLHLDGSAGTLASMNVSNCRPQVSGTANLKANDCTFLTISGGFNDTAITGGNGHGIQIADCVNWTVTDVIFYSNGDNKSHIHIDSLSGKTCLDGIITNCHTIQSGSNTGTITGIEFGSIAGTCRRITIDNNDLQGVDQSILFNTVTGTLERISIGAGNILKVGASIIGAANVANTLMIGDADGHAVYESRNVPTVDVVLDAASPRIQRITGTLTASINYDLPTTGNWAGKTIRIIRKDAGAFTVTVRYNGVTTAHQLTTANQWVDLAAIGTGATWVETASDDLSR